MIAAVWILSVVVSLPPLVGWKRPQRVVDGFPLCLLSEEPGYVIYSTIGSFYVPLVVIVVVYSKIYMAARTRARRNLAALSQGQRSRRTGRQVTQSVSRSTTASNLSNQPRTIPPDVDQKDQDMAGFQLRPPRLTTVPGGVACLTPVTDPGGSSSEATVSRSEPDEVAAEPDFDLEQDEDALSDGELDSDDEDVAPTGPQVVFSTAVTVDLAVPVQRQRHATTDISSYSPGDDETSAGMAGLPASSASQAAGVMAERERVRRRVARSRERRATVVLGIVMVSFIGCWLPFFSVYPLSLLFEFSVPAHVFAVIFWLGYCNSALNPIIYTIFNRDFRGAFRRMLCPGRSTTAKPPARF